MSDWLEKGAALERDKRWGEARDCYTAALASGVEDGRLHLRLGVVLWRLGKAAASVAALNRAVAASPNDAEPLAARSRSLRAQIKEEQARRDAVEAVRINPESAAAQRELGITIAGGTAVEHLRRAVALDPGDVEAWVSLGRRLSGFVATQAEALACFERAVALDGSDRDAKRGLAAMLSQLGRDDQSRTVLEDAAAVSSDDWRAHFDLVRALAETDRAGALRHLARVKELAPWSGHLVMISKELDPLRGEPEYQALYPTPKVTPPPERSPPEEGQLTAALDARDEIRPDGDWESSLYERCGRWHPEAVGRSLRARLDDESLRVSALMALGDAARDLAQLREEIPGTAEEEQWKWIDEVLAEVPAEPVMACLGDSNAAVRAAAARAASALFERHNLQGRQLCELIEDPNDQVREQAAEALAYDDSPAATRALAGHISDRHPGIRSTAASALRYRGHPAVVPQLIAGLDDETTRLDCCAALAWVRDCTAAVPKLLEVLAADYDLGTTRHALEALAASRDRRAIPALIERLSAGKVDAELIQALARCGAAAALPQLIARFPSGTMHERARIVEALGWLGGPAQLELLDSLRHDEQLAVDAALSAVQIDSHRLDGEEGALILKALGDDSLSPWIVENILRRLDEIAERWPPARDRSTFARKLLPIARAAAERSRRIVRHTTGAPGFLRNAANFFASWP